MIRIDASLLTIQTTARVDHPLADAIEPTSSDGNEDRITGRRPAGSCCDS